MNTPESTVSQIRQLIESETPPAGIDGAALARTYAALCRDANSRLHTCQLYIAKGMLSEMLRLAATEPSLLDLCATLRFGSIETWSQFVAANNWSPAEPIDKEAVAAINGAWSAADSAEPTLRRFRNAVHRRDFAQCVCLLRQLASMEPGQPFWTHDLKVFEARRLEELAQRFTAAQAADDDTALEALFEELNQPWREDAHEPLKVAVSEVLGRRRAAHGEQRIKTLIAHVSDAYAALDYGALEEALQAYDAVMAEGYCTPDANTAMQYEEAREWYLDQRHTRAQRDDFRHTLAELRAELDKPVPGRRIESLLLALRRHEEAVPVDIERRACHVIDNLRLGERRRRRRQVILISLAAAGVAALLAGSAWWWQYQRAKRFWVGQIKHAVDTLDVARFDELKAAIRNYRPYLYGKHLYDAPTIQEWVLKRPDLVRHIAERREHVEHLLADLAAIQSDGFQVAAERFTTLLSDAEKLAIDSDQKQRIDQMAAGWKAHVRQHTAGQNVAIENIIRQIAENIPNFSDLGVSNIAELETQLAQLRQLLTAGRKIDGASPEVVARLEAYAAEIESLDAGIAEHKAALARIEARKEQSLRALEAASSLDAYMAALLSFATQFPDDGRARAVAPIVANRNHYLSFEPSLTQRTARQPKRISIAWCYKDIAPDNYFWYPYSRSALALESQLQARWDGVRNAIAVLGKDELFATLYRLPVEGNEEPIFLAGKLDKRNIGFMDENIRYNGRVYAPSALDAAPRFEARELAPQTKQPQHPMAHCTFVADLLRDAEASEPERGDLLLIAAIEALHANTRIMTPFLELRLMKALAEQFVNLMGPRAIPEIAAALREMEALDNESLCWLCVANPAVRDMNEPCRQLLARHFDDTSYINLYRLKRAMQERHLSRGAEWIGFVSLEEDLRIHLRGARRPEIWVLREGSKGRMSVKALILTPGGDYDRDGPLQPGEPLYAPRDNVPTRTLIDSLCRQAGVKEGDSNSIPWPSSWPTNVRSLPSASAAAARSGPEAPPDADPTALR